MTKVIGITGLIGSGKSVVVRTWSKLYDVPTFDSDQQAKEIYKTPRVRQLVINKLGIDPILADNSLNKQELRNILAHPEQRKALEEIVHSNLNLEFQEWVKKQNAPMVLLESAILFTSGYNKGCHFTVSVVADQETRQKRVMQRDADMSEAQFQKIVEIQREEAILQSNGCDFIIDNNGSQSLIQQVEQIHQKILLH